MNWKSFVLRHWKAILILTQIGIVALAMFATKAHAEPIDSPHGP